MNRSEFEQMCREQNRRVAQARVQAREQGAECKTISMLAFGGIDYCQTHGVMGPCPYRKAVQS